MILDIGMMQAGIFVRPVQKAFCGRWADTSQASLHMLISVFP